MSCNSQSFKRNLGCASLVVLAAILSSPHASAMEPEDLTMEVEGVKTLKRKEPPVEDNNDPQKKHCMEKDEPPLWVQYSTLKSLQGLINQAIEGDEGAQDKLMKLRRLWYWVNHITPEAIQFTTWDRIQERCYQKPEYTECVLHFYLAHDQSFPELFEKTKELAKLGDGDSQNTLALMHYFGCGIKKDVNKAFKYFKKSAKKGNMYGQNNLGGSYYDGGGCEQDLERAVKYWERSAAQGHVNSLACLGKAYFLKGWHSKAYKYWTLAAEQGYASSQLILATHSLKGQWVDLDYAMALGLAYKALKNQMIPLLPQDQQEAKALLSSLLTFKKPGAVPPDLENIQINLDDFHSKTKVLTVDTGFMVAVHNGDYLDPDYPLAWKGLLPLYENLATYGAQLNAQAEIIQKNLKTPGFLMLCGNPIDMLKYESSQLSEDKGREHYQPIFMCGEVFSCIGDQNPQLGYDLGKVLDDISQIKKTIKKLKINLNAKKEALESLYRVESQEITQKALTQIETELKLCLAAKEVINESIDYLRDVIVKTAPLRDKAFMDENPELFQ